MLRIFWKVPNSHWPSRTSPISKDTGSIYKTYPSPLVTFTTKKIPVLLKKAAAFDTLIDISVYSEKIIIIQRPKSFVQQISAITKKFPI
jgi:hypothetical protein